MADKKYYICKKIYSGSGLYDSPDEAAKRSGYIDFSDCVICEVQKFEIKKETKTVYSLGEEVK